MRKVYRLAQPRLMTIFPRIARMSEPTLTVVSYPAIKPPTVLPMKYVIHIHAMANAQTRLFEIM